jgi:L-rhamnose mutarotase
MQRYGMLIGIHPEKIDEYRRLHAAVWPAVLERLWCIKEILFEARGRAGVSE